MGGERLDNTNTRFIEAARQFLAEHPIPHYLCSFAGGSVGRGDADEYSDLDLNVYVDINLNSYSENYLYNDIAIQLHVHRLPDLETVLNDPWSYRFLSEARRIDDQEEVFHTLRSRALSFFESEEGKRRMLDQARSIVKQRQQWSVESLQKNNEVTATFAALAAWTDAAFMYTYFKHNSLATGKLIPLLRELDLYNQFKELRFAPGDYDIAQLELTVKDYRGYLRTMKPKTFALDEMQDSLIHRKIQRLWNHQDQESIVWLLHAEAFWMYLSAREGESLEQHIESLPLRLQTGLWELGFEKMDQTAIEELLENSRMILSLI
jgi:hypothetical protein